MARLVLLELADAAADVVEGSGQREELRRPCRAGVSLGEQGGALFLQVRDLPAPVFAGELPAQIVELLFRPPDVDVLVGGGEQIFDRRFRRAARLSDRSFGTHGDLRDEAGADEDVLRHAEELHARLLARCDLAALPVDDADALTRSREGAFDTPEPPVVGAGAEGPGGGPGAAVQVASALGHAAFSRAGGETVKDELDERGDGGLAGLVFAAEDVRAVGEVEREVFKPAEGRDMEGLDDHGKPF